MDMLAKALALFPASKPYADALVACCERHQINTPRRVASFIATLAVESGRFRHTREIWGPTAQQLKYSPPHKVAKDLGNDKPQALAYAAAAFVDVGRFYAGHGLIQITGYDNHLAYSMATYGDDRCARAPRLLEQPLDAVRSAGWFWSTKKLNARADTLDLIDDRRAVNGGTHGMSDFEAYFNQVLKAVT